MNELPYMLSFLEGVLTFISPCILPMLPIYFFYLAGISSEENAGHSRLLMNSIAFVIGFSIVFIMLGATATTLGAFLTGHIAAFRYISGLVMIIFGLNFMGIFNLNLLNYEKHFDVNVKNLKFLNSIFFGMVFAFGWTPCVGVFLGSALLMAANSSSMVHGMLLLGLYSAGLGLPFLLSSVLFEAIRNTFRQIQTYSRIINIVSGLVLVLAGILLISNHLAFPSI